MRCLFCGKELALFKRLTGGGEFCSDAHRQKYQEEYNQLALNRLLQASSSPEKASAPPRISKAGEIKGLLDVVGVATSGGELFDPFADKPRIEFLPEPMNHAGADDNLNDLDSPEPSNFSGSVPEEGGTETAGEALPPAEPRGFFLEVPSFATVAAANIALSALDMIWSENLVLPSSEVAIHENLPFLAGAIALETNLAPKTTSAAGRSQALELRAPARPLVGANGEFPPLDRVGLEATAKTMEINILAAPPQSAALIWETAAKEFVGPNPQLGELGRLAFATAGWGEFGGASVLAPGISARSATDASVAETEPDVVEDVVEEAGGEKIETPSARKPIPAVVTQPLPMTLHGHAPSRGKPVQVFPSAITRAAAVQIPRSTALPLRPTMFWGPISASAPAKAEPAPAVKPATPAARQETAKPAPKREVRTPADLKNIVKTAPTVKLPPIGKPVERKDALKPAAAKPVETKPAETKPVVDRVIEPKVAETKLAEIRLVEAKKTSPTPPPEIKTEPPPPRQTETKGRRPEIRTLLAPSQTESRKQVEVKPQSKLVEPKSVEAKPVKTMPVERPTEAKLPGPKFPGAGPIEAKPVEEVKEEKAGAAQAECRPESKPEQKVRKEVPKGAPVPAPLAAPESFTEFELRLPQLGTEVNEGFWSKLPLAVKGLIGAVLVGGLVFGGIYLRKQNPPAGVKAPLVVAAGTVLSSGDAGWETDWAPDRSISKRQRRINLMRASNSLSDYRLEFEGEIETKALGWVYRASNPKNFYVEKVEIVKPGLEPVIRLVRFAVVDGVEQPHQDVPLSLKVRPDTMYKIRFEAVGDRFTTWILDQKVDEWSDSRIATGGVGLYSEAGESLSLKGGLNVAPLVVKR